jgi:5-methylcytosine-specific restriction protein A
MPYAPPHPCSQPGCAILVNNGSRCDIHAKQREKELDAKRANANVRGYNAAWHKSRRQFLGQHPLCVVCESEGRIEPATVVDHIIPHKGDWRVFWDESNWQSLCEHHHNQKTAREGRWR